jgi:hypothetical protein
VHEWPRDDGRLPALNWLGTKLATTLGWPGFCHAAWAMDNEVLKSLERSVESEDEEARPQKIVHTV